MCASLLDFLRAGPPPPRVAVLPDAVFFSRAISLPAGAQEVVDKIIGETGGQPIRLHLPEMPDGEIVFDESGNVFRLERKQLPDGQTQERHIFLFRVTEHGSISA